MLSKFRLVCVVLSLCGSISLGTAFAQQIQVIPIAPSNSTPATGNQGANQGTIPGTVQQPGYPTQQPTYPAQQPGYPTQPPAYPAQQPGYPVQQPTYPAQQPTYPAQPPTPSVLQQQIPGAVSPAPVMTAPMPQLRPAPTPAAVPAAGMQQMVPEGVEPLSPFELFMSGQMPPSISFDIKQFGYDLFKEVPTTFAPVENVPVGPNYVIGSGDIIRVSVWGSIEGAWNVEVDRDGNIALPKVGVIGVVGLTFEQLQGVLRKELSKYFTDFEMNVSLGQLRSIRIYVVGNALRPGAYSVSSLSTLINALFAAGGPSKTGSMRDIQLKRSGRTISHLDLYDFLLNGDKSKDERVMPEDVIFIPPIGPIAGVAGYVKRPAIYELKGSTTMKDLIRMAGGLTGQSFKGRFQILRVQDHQLRGALEGDLVDIQRDPRKNIALQDGDLLQIFAVAEDKNLATLQGAVLSPGEFGITPGKTTIKDIVSRAGGLRYYASNRAEITRTMASPKGPQSRVMQVDLNKAMMGDPKENVVLERNDYILVQQVPDWALHTQVGIYGEVKFPGVYTVRQGEKLTSLLERAGGYTDRAYPRGAIFIRQRTKMLQKMQLTEMANRLERELIGSGVADIGAAADSKEAEALLMENRQKLQFINMLKQIEAQGRMVVDLQDPVKMKGTYYDIELEAGDMLTIPKNPQTIQIIGAVYNQTAFVYEPGKGVSHYINLAGGYTNNADTGEIYVMKANGAAGKPKGGLSWDSTSHKWVSGASGFLEPGDTIVVPDKLDKIAWLRNIKDITQILFQVMTSAGIAFRVL